MGAVEVTQIYFHPNLIFCSLKPHAKFQNPTITPLLCAKITWAEREITLLLIVDT
jgi:hypothetical protein